MARTAATGIHGFESKPETTPRRPWEDPAGVVAAISGLLGIEREVSALAAEKEIVKRVAIAGKARAERVRCISLVLQSVISHNC